MHVHVRSSDAEAKFWLEPCVELSFQRGLSPKEVKQLSRLIEERSDEIKQHWKKHFDQ